MDDEGPQNTSARPVATPSVRYRDVNATAAAMARVVAREEARKLRVSADAAIVGRLQEIGARLDRLQELQERGNDLVAGTAEECAEVAREALRQIHTAADAALEGIRAAADAARREIADAVRKEMLLRVSNSFSMDASGIPKVTDGLAQANHTNGHDSEADPTETVQDWVARLRRSE